MWTLHYSKSQPANMLITGATVAQLLWEKLIIAMGTANNNFLIGFKDHFIRWIPGNHWLGPKGLDHRTRGEHCIISLLSGHRINYTVRSCLHTHRWGQHDWGRTLRGSPYLSRWSQSVRIQAALNQLSFKREYMKLGGPRGEEGKRGRRGKRMRAGFDPGILYVHMDIK